MGAAFPRHATHQLYIILKFATSPHSATEHLEHVQMSLISGLPDEYVHALLLSWLNVKAIGRLDSAVCNKIERLHFLNVVGGDKFVLGQTYVRSDWEEDLTPVDIDMFTAWFMRRKIAVAEIIVTKAIVHKRDVVATYVKRHGHHVRSVIVQRHLVLNYDQREAIINNLCAHCPNVLMLKCDVYLSCKTQSTIAASWSNLTDLTIHGYSEFAAISERCESLVEGSLHRFFRCCSPVLQRISTDVTLGYLVYVAIASRCPLLRELGAPSDTIDDAALAILAGGCPLINILDLDDNSMVTDAGIASIARNGALTELSVRNCENLTDEAFMTVAECCPLLEFLWAGNTSLSDPALVAIGQHSHNLLMLDSTATSVTHVGLAAVAAGCPLLEGLSVEDCEMTGQAVEAIARGCPRLRWLRAQQTGLPPTAVLSLAECCPLLRNVDLGHNGQVGDEEIIVLVRGCPALMFVNVSGTSVTAQGLRAIRAFCSDLQEIEFDASLFEEEFDEVYFPPDVTVKIN
jgi:hypothetical protein